MAAYPPTALTGVNDWADTEPVDDGIRRAGLVHAVVERDGAGALRALARRPAATATAARARAAQRHRGDAR